MAVTGTPSNKIKYLLMTGAINLSTDTLKCVLAKTGYTFDRDTDEYYSDVSANELASGYGYTTGGQTLTGVTVTENDTSDRADMACTNPSWTASGGSIGPTPGAWIIDDTATSDPIIGYIDFDGDQTTTTGNDFVIADVIVRLS
jgi:hypothetical protein